jgi:hypothetical protein
MGTGVAGLVLVHSTDSIPAANGSTVHSCFVFLNFLLSEIAEGIRSALHIKAQSSQEGSLGCTQVH